MFKETLGSVEIS